MKLIPLIVFMVFMMNVREDIMFVCGNCFPTALNAYLYVPL